MKVIEQYVLEVVTNCYRFISIAYNIAFPILCSNYKQFCAQIIGCLCTFKKNATITQMRFKHDCNNCKPLGEHGAADLYFCNQGGVELTVIARYGNEGADYTSGLCAAPYIPDLAEAKRRAIAYGLLTHHENKN